MADNMIKDFVKKQTTPLTIGVPRQRPAEAEQQPAAAAPAAPAASQPVAVQQPQVAQVEPEATPAPVVKGRIGRPKSDIEKVKLSVYVPAEAKAKLIRIQHQNFKSSLNDVLMEAISDLIKKYETQ